jgi:hypothetical protein
MSKKYDGFDPNFDPRVYKNLYNIHRKYDPQRRSFWIKTNNNSTSNLEFIPALVLSFLAWPIMIWYWTKSFIYPIFSIPASATLFGFSIYFWIFDQSPSFYLCTGYLFLILSFFFWALSLQDLILKNHFPDENTQKRSLKDFID